MTGGRLATMPGARPAHHPGRAPGRVNPGRVNPGRVNPGRVNPGRVNPSARYLEPNVRDILCYLAEGLDLSAIARRIPMSERTVRRRLAALRDATGCQSATQLAVWATVSGLITPELPPPPRVVEYVHPKPGESRVTRPGKQEP